MAVTESPPGATAASEAAPPPVRARATGLAAVLGSADHKVIGRGYIVVAVLFGLASAVTGQLVAVERIDTSRFDILSRDTSFQVLTFHSVTATFLFVVPLVLGLALVVVPLQVGAPSVAFPRAAAASFWTWLVAGALVIVSYAINGGPGGGRSDGVDLWTAALAATLVALMVGAACVLTTVLALRAPGMDLGRVPMFAWSAMVASAMWLLTLPVLVGTLVLVYVDHRNGQHTFGRNAEIYSRILWALRNPQVYAFAVPVLGFAGDVLAVTARTRQAMRGVAMGAIAAFGALGFGAFLQLSVYGDAVEQPAYIGMSFLAVLPVLALIAVWADLFRRGTLTFRAPMVFAVAAVLMLFVAVLAGAVGSITALEVANTTWDAAVTHYATLATLIAMLGGLHWWATKVLRRPVSEGLGVVSALVLLLGTVLLAFPDIISALIGERGEEQAGVESLNTVAAAGGVVLIIGVLAAVLNLLGGLRKPRGAVDRDPWEGHTLEWATDSPPPLENFAQVPEVRSAEPLLDQREEASS